MNDEPLFYFFPHNRSPAISWFINIMCCFMGSCPCGSVLSSLPKAAIATIFKKISRTNIF